MQPLPRSILIVTVLLVGSVGSLAAAEPANVRWIGRTSVEGDVATIADKTASLVLGSDTSAHYQASVEVRLAPEGSPLGVVLLADAPHDGSAGGLYRLNFARSKGGISLVGRRISWNAETKRWENIKESAIIDFQPDPNAKGIKPILADMQRDGVNPVPFPERWLQVRLDVSASNADLWIEGLLVRRVPLGQRLTGPCALILSKGDRVRNVKCDPLPSHSTWLPIDLALMLGSGLGTSTPVSTVTDQEVPFLVCDGGKQTLDLRKAGWPDAQRDPSSYNESYDDGPLFLHDLRTPTLRVPVEDYCAVHVLAVADDDTNTVAGFTVRAGHLSTRQQCVVYDFPSAVPRRNALPKADSKTIVTLGDQSFVHVAVPLTVAFSQDIFQWIDLQLTKEIRLARRRPDPSRFRFRPLGLPSGVRIAAITLERSPVQVRVTSKESGHVFLEPNKPEFMASLRNLSTHRQSIKMFVTATHLDGTRTEMVPQGEIQPGKTENFKIEIPVSKRGYYDLKIVITANTKQLTRTTSFALLPPDTRKHRDQSPFGAWDFSGAHFTCPDADIAGSLYQKAGLLYGMSGFTAEARKKWGVRQSHEPKLIKTIEQYNEWKARSPDAWPDAMLLHEHAVSGGHTTRVPDIFHDRSPYKMNETERKQFDGLVDIASSMARLMRSNAPNLTLSMGNGALPLQEELLRQKFPKELFDSLGNESASFGRPPETQPPDYVANNAALWMQHELLKAYGYDDKSVTQCYEVCYPNTNPGNLDPSTQAAYFVRHCMHSLAWGIPVFRFGTICDVGSSYHFGNWGAAGLVRAWPELNVKPAFVAVATMTRMLDGAKFARALDLGSPSLYGVEFSRADQKRVYVLWTIRGERPVRFPSSSGSWMLTDEQGNDKPVTARDGKLEIPLTPSPVYLVGDGELKNAEPGAAIYNDEPPDRLSDLSLFHSLDGWKLEADRNYLLEYHNFMTPRRKGDFKFEAVEEFEGQKKAMRVTPQPIAGGKPTMPMYSVLRHQKGIPIPGEPTEIGLWVNGNSSWGRVIFELQDARGQTWISIGASQRGELSPWLLDWMPKEALEDTRKSTQADWNTDDVFGFSRINFDGWRYVGFPLPGNYPGEQYPWPASSQWKYDGDGVVHYPLTFRALIIELPEKTLRLTNYQPVPRKEIYLKRLVVAQDDKPTVKTAISEWERP